MTRDRVPNTAPEMLKQFFGAYFHGDRTDEVSAPDHAFSAFIADRQRPEDLSWVADMMVGVPRKLAWSLVMSIDWSAKLSSCTIPVGDVLRTTASYLRQLTNLEDLSVVALRASGAIRQTSNPEIATSH